MENSYFAQEHGVNQLKVDKSKKWVSIPTFIISLLMVAGLVVLLFLKWDDIMWFFGTETNIQEVENNQALSVWDEVVFRWNIKNDGDMVNYTHSYLSDEYWIIWLKSSKLNLNEFSEDVYFEWIVEKINREIPIVNVTKIYDLQEDNIEYTWNAIESWENLDVNDKYLPKLWLYFGEKFFEKYSLVNEWDGSVLKIKNLDTNVIYSVNYFKCNTVSQWSENCKYLLDWYSTSSINKLVDKYWVNYYKLSERDYWFFSNDLIIWYKINDVDESFVRDLSTLMTVVNKSFVEKTILPNVKSLCTMNHSSIDNISKSEVLHKDWNIYYTIEWTDDDNNTMVCELRVDPTLSLFAQVEKVEIVNNEEWNNEDVKVNNEEWTGEVEQENRDQNESQNIDSQAYIWDTDVEQFPINLDKKLTFTSSRGHSFIFPSSNLAYQWVNVSEDFGQVWVNCFSAMNVVKYADKELVESQWNVVIYECNIKNTFDDSDKTLIYREVWDKKFVIQINDPARVDFANNIEIVA